MKERIEETIEEFMYSQVFGLEISQEQIDEQRKSLVQNHKVQKPKESVLKGQERIKTIKNAGGR